MPPLLAADHARSPAAASAAVTDGSGAQGANEAENTICLSVILPNYNHAHFLQRAVEALLAQARPADEILIIDDASTDDSRLVVEALARENPTIRLLFNETNVGAIPTLMRGLNAARGTYIYFAAADDWVWPGFFSLALDMLRQYPQAGLFCGEARLEDGPTGRLYGLRPAVRPMARAGYLDPRAVAALLRKADNFILTGSAIFRRDYVLQAGGFDLTLSSYADGYLARKVIARHGFCFAPEIVATWCVFDEGLSRTTALDPAQAQDMLARVPERLRSDPEFPAWYREIFERRWRFATSRLALLAEPVNGALLEAMSTHPALDRAMLRASSRMLPAEIVRNLMLAWLWFRLRPISLLALSRTKLARLWERARPWGRR